MYKLGRDYPQKREMRRLSEKIFDESKTARRVYLDCRENLFVVAGKLKDAWRYKELGKLTTTDSLYVLRLQDDCKEDGRLTESPGRFFRRICQQSVFPLFRRYVLL